MLASTFHPETLQITIVQIRQGTERLRQFVNSIDATERRLEIDLLVVDEKHRRKGIGKALFNEVQKRARKVGAKRVNLTVWSYNKIAESAYESYGMTPLRSVYEIGIS